MDKNLIKQIEKYVNTLLMPLENYSFHQFKHALEVKNRVIQLAKKEWLKEDETEIIIIAALFHDTGFIMKYDNNEYIWAKIAQNYLKSILYPMEKIDIVERLIMATKPDYRTPIDILEEIIKDADLDNLGRDDFFEKENNLKKEIETIKKITLKNIEWKYKSLEFIKNYSYFSKSQKEERNDKKIENEKKLEKMILDLENEEKYKKRFTV